MSVFVSKPSAQPKASRMGPVEVASRPMTYDLTDLQLFLQVVDQGSITQGADRSHLSLASASARIKAMEKALGAPLLVRHRRGVVPSPAGWLLVAHAREVVGQIARMRSE